ncbi:hypothetical protein [Streptomyces sp. NPDC048411]|uniref:hypothetical protein n=1 Tax=Streptomyces sp. NPDC048411 TaxID=3157206 RepID=UPI0034555A28
MLDGLHGYAMDILVFGIPVLAGALLFIWRNGNLRRRGVVIRAVCVNKAFDGKGLVTLRLEYEVAGLRYYCDSMPYRFPPVGVGQRLDVIYDSKKTRLLGGGGTAGPRHSALDRRRYRVHISPAGRYFLPLTSGV